MKAVVLLFFLLGSGFSAAQTGADMSAEPHHHLMLEDDQVRVFAVTLRQNEAAVVRHEHNYLFITLQDSDLILWAEGASPVTHFLFRQGETLFLQGGPTAGGIRNDRSSDFRALIVEFLNPKVTALRYDYENGGWVWQYGSGAISPPVDPHAKYINQFYLGAAVMSDAQLLAGDAFPPPPKQADELLIALTDVDLSTKADKHFRRTSGDVLSISAGRSWDLTNASNAPVRFVAVALWKESAQ